MKRATQDKAQRRGMGFTRARTDLAEESLKVGFSGRQLKATVLTARHWGCGCQIVRRRWPISRNDRPRSTPELAMK